MKIKEAKEITGSMTRTSKMPGLSYSLPAWECKTGAKLVKVPGSVCAGCYAMKGNYTRYPAIKAAQYKRLASINKPEWVMAMVIQIKRQKFLSLIHISEPTRRTPISYAVFCLKKNTERVCDHYAPPRHAQIVAVF